MSNTIVAAVYSQIIKDVAISVQKDFEDNGIDLSVLHDLEKMWETRVVNSDVANFDILTATFPQPAIPTPEEGEAAAVQNSSLPLAGGAVPEYSYYEQFANQEPAYGHSDLSAMNYNPMLVSNPNTAQYAASNMGTIASHSGLGNMANNQLPTSSNHNGTPQVLNNGNSYGNQHFQQGHPTQLNNYNGHLQGDYSNYQMNNLTHNDMYGNPINQGVDYSISGTSEPYLPPTGPPQLDGAVDLETKETKREAADRWLLEKIIKKANKKLPQLDGDATDPDLDTELDSRLDDNYNDEDAINSDLDDSDEGEADDTERDGITDIILCQYDKVSRTKNRWRCSLKDGLISVNGKDYLFNKATGEFQW